ncbi:MAG: tyrosine-type recombinase/integrase [Thermonemataceae bacterium]|mgnify:CR=1 FL=1
MALEQSITLKSSLKEALTQYLKEKHAPSTVKRYLREIELFISSLETLLQNPVTANYNQIMVYLGELRHTQSNITPCLCAIKKYYSYLVAQGIRKDNPAQAIKLRDHRNRDIQLQDLFTPQELALLLERKERYPLLKNRNQLILSLLIYQALTNGDIINLTLDDLDLAEGKIHIKAARKTNARTLLLQPKQVYLLMNYLQTDRPQLLKEQTSQLIISSRGHAETGEGISYLVETCKGFFPNRKLNAKTIRQSVITNLLKSGKDLRLVQAFAGHKYPSSTEKYKQSHLEALKNQVLKYHPLDNL